MLPYLRAQELERGDNVILRTHASFRSGRRFLRSTSHFSVWCDGGGKEGCDHRRGSVRGLDLIPRVERDEIPHATEARGSL